jgi:tRNA nucleotidyltransferase (CCA-adding enzyme)
MAGETQLPARLEIPEPVLAIARTLQDAGHDTWCVGGAVRDAIAGRPTSDFDLATAATPDQVIAIFKRTVPVGVEFGTVGVFGSDKVLHEVTTFRHDVTTDGRRAVVKWGKTIDEDLARRDFTINAIAYHPLRHEWRDPYDGATDLLLKQEVRAVGKAEERFQEDYLRILRGARFAARFRYCIEKGTWASMVEHAPGMAALSAERVREEWFKMLRTAVSLVWALKLWRPLIAKTAWMPELLEGDPPEFPGEIERDPIELTVLLAGAGAPALLGRLKASNAEIARATAMVEGPERPSTDDPRAVRHWMAEVGAAEEDLIDLWHLRTGELASWAPVVAGIRSRGEATSRGQLAVSGDDLMQAGVPRGPAIGATLDRLLTLVLDDPSLNRRETLLARARENA